MCPRLLKASRPGADTRKKNGVINECDKAKQDHTKHAKHVTAKFEQVQSSEKISSRKQKIRRT